jgi:chorismate mutase / prephenate dehydrogenase
VSDLEDLRDQIKDIDEEILLLVRRRNEAARRIGEIKREGNLPLQNFEIERSVLDHALEVAREEGVHEETARGLVRLLIEAALRVQETSAPRRPAPTGRSALVVGGAGLMGSWFCRFLEERGYSVDVDDPRPSPYPRGRPGGRKYDLVLVATPPSTLPEIVGRIGDSLTDSTLLVDVGSVKGETAAVLKRLAKKGRRVASLHPMFGPRTELLMGRNVLVLDAGRPEAAKAAGALFEDTAARTLHLPLDEHDRLMAEVLTLAHATSLAFNQALARGGRRYEDLEPVASTTFRRQTDVSREVASENPRLYYEIQALNPASDGVLARLEASVHDLRRLVGAHDEAGFVRFMEEGRGVYGGRP